MEELLAACREELAVADPCPPMRMLVNERDATQLRSIGLSDAFFDVVEVLPS